MYFNKAIYEAHKSNFDERHGAVVLYKNKIVGSGFNKVCFQGNRFVSTHAEIDALNKTIAKYRHNCTVVVCRVNREGLLRLSKPCEHCQRRMKKMGVKYVIYSTSVITNSWERMVL